MSDQPIRSLRIFKSAIALALTTALFGVVLWFAWGRSFAYDVCSGVTDVQLSTNCYEEEFSTPFQVFVTSIVSLLAAATIVPLGWLLGRHRAETRARPCEAYRQRPRPFPILSPLAVVLPLAGFSVVALHEIAREQLAWHTPQMDPLVVGAGQIGSLGLPLAAWAAVRREHPALCWLAGLLCLSLVVWLNFVDGA
jgi:hypothetical protein